MKVEFYKKYKQLKELSNDLDTARFIIPKRYLKNFKIIDEPLQLKIYLEYAEDEKDSAESYFYSLKKWGFEKK